MKESTCMKQSKQPESSMAPPNSIESNMQPPSMFDESKHPKAMETTDPYAQQCTKKTAISFGKAFFISINGKLTGEAVSRFKRGPIQHRCAAGSNGKW